MFISAGSRKCSRKSRKRERQRRLQKLNLRKRNPPGRKQRNKLLCRLPTAICHLPFDLPSAHCHLPFAITDHLALPRRPSMPPTPKLLNSKTPLSHLPLPSDL